MYAGCFPSTSWLTHSPGEGMFVVDGGGTQNPGEWERRAALEDVPRADRHMRTPGTGSWPSGERDGGRRTPKINSFPCRKYKANPGLGMKGVFSPNRSLAWKKGENGRWEFYKHNQLWPLLMCLLLFKCSWESDFVTHPLVGSPSFPGIPSIVSPTWSLFIPSVCDIPAARHWVATGS